MAATFIVEDGTKVPDANAYLSVADATQFVENLSSAVEVVAWLAYAADVQQTAIRNATAVLDQMYHLRWIGTRATTTQGLDWPRYDAEDVDCYIIPSTSVPEKVQRATTILAVQSAAGVDLWADLSGPVGGIKKKTVKVGPLMQSIEYAGAASQSRRFTRAFAELRGLVTGSGQISRS